MSTVESLPHQVREVEHVWVPMPDGVRLSAHLWLPVEAEREPVPAILEYIPYRHRDFMRPRDATMHPWFAGHGYAAVRVDLRGSGNSEGVLLDEYLPQELDDGEAVLAWLAAQDWCDGSVGIMGISWGGFNALQLAARRPPQLKAVISAASTDDRYADDVHYMGGCLLGDNLSWASTMFAYNSLPPDPAIVGERWREMWFERLKHNDPWLITWLRHQHRNGYWKHGSICEDFRDVQVPVMAISGWADGYTNAVFRLMENLHVPRQGWIGPWSHKYPHLGVPGPAIGFLQVARRWWDRWLRGEPNGVEDEPRLRVWMQDSVPPSPTYRHRPGRWIAERAWPSPHVHTQRHTLAPGRILATDATRPEQAQTIQSPLTVGQFAGKWCSYAATPDLPHDQREEDGGALTFDSEPLHESIELLGRPAAELELTASQPVAMIAVRLHDVAPDGKATRVAYGVLNLTHRHSHEHPQPLDPGERFRIHLELNAIAQHFPRGHRLRLAISTSYWPLAWPPPEPVRLTVYTGTSQLLLPIRPPRADDELLEPPPPPESTPTPLETHLTPIEHNWFVHTDLGRDCSTLEVIKDDGTWHLAGADVNLTSRTWEWYTIANDAFSSARGETKWTRGLSRGDWSVRTETRTVLTCTETDFRIDADLDAYENDRRVYCRTWYEVIPRKLV
ncbi:MAG: CocE/NonD family hydrolase [Phycisphaeraceae bacterium]